MGMAVGAGKKGGRRTRGVPRYGAMADINMTPFIDVMLVLLIVFMVAAPLMTTGVKVDLPQVRAGAIDPQEKSIRVVISSSGAVYLNDQTTPISDDAILQSVSSLLNGSTTEKVMIFGDKAVAYARPVEVLVKLKNGGVDQATIVTDPQFEAKRP